MPVQGSWQSLRFDFEAMAAPCSILLDGWNQALLEQGAEAAIEEVRRIETKYSRYLSDSVVSRINSAAGIGSVIVDEETTRLLDFAHQLWQTSGGLFDPTSGVLRRAWDFRQARVPAASQIQALLPLVGWQQVQWQDRQIQLSSVGMELDFGGFGKEYAADRAASVLFQHGIRHALVNLGGDVHVLGPRGLPALQGQPWQVGVQHPRPTPIDDLVASLPLVRGALATSGDYERFFEVDGRRYCHILDPRNGWPVSYWQSVTVLAPNATTAGALSTIAMLMGEGALEWLDDQDSAYLAVRHDNEIFRRGTASQMQ